MCMVRARGYSGKKVDPIKEKVAICAWSWRICVVVNETSLSLFTMEENIEHGEFRKQYIAIADNLLSKISYKVV